MFNTLLNEIATLAAPHGEVWFRGQSDSTWPLIPRLLRAQAGMTQEKNILSRFRTRAMSILPNPPTDSDPARWLFLMQHNGLPTRLLDWTESALAALYFAAQDHDERDGCVYIMLPIELNNSQTNEQVLYMPYSERMHKLLLACFKGTEKSPEVLALLAYASNDRISRQQGNFTVHGSANDLREKSNANWFRSICIPAAAKANVRTQLAYFGVTRATLFNDLDSLAKDIREQHGVG